MDFKSKFFSQPEGNSTKTLLFKNAIIVDVEAGKEVKGDVLVKAGYIQEVGKVSEQKGKDVEIIDCEGHYLCPGIIDAEVHIGEPGGAYKENIMQTTRSAVAGGVTTVNIMPDTNPAIDTTAMVEFIKNRANEKAFCNVTVFGAITKGLEGREISEIGLMKKAGVKGFSEGSGYVVDSQVFRRACEYATDFDAVIAQQPQDKFLNDGGVINEGEVSTELGVTGIPAISEKIGLERDLAIVEIVGNKYHASNISTEMAADSLRAAKRKKLNVTASVNPHHISLTEKEANKYRTFAKTTPPLREESDRKAMIKALKDGTIDFIASNNSPRSEDQKRLPLAQAEFGVVGLETMLAASLTYLIPEKFSIAEVFRLLSHNSAKFLGLTDRGVIKKGCVADIILVDINSKWHVNPEHFVGKAVNSPYDGFELRGKVLKTFIDGEKVYEVQS